MSAPRPRLADSLRDRCVRLLRGATAALSTASAALLDSRPGQDDAALRQAVCLLRAELDQYVGTVLAPLDDESPVEPRTIISGVHLGTEIDALAELAVSLADLARSRVSRPPPAPRDVLCRMAGVCRAALAEAGAAVKFADPALAADLDRIRAECAGLRGALYQRLATGGPDVDARTIVDLTLAGRYYESCVDHACAVAAQAAFLAVGSAGPGRWLAGPATEQRESV
jgi:hypothetical protein